MQPHKQSRCSCREPTGNWAKTLLTPLLCNGITAVLPEQNGICQPTQLWSGCLSSARELFFFYKGLHCFVMDKSHHLDHNKTVTSFQVLYLQGLGRRQLGSWDISFNLNTHQITFGICIRLHLVYIINQSLSRDRINHWLGPKPAWNTRLQETKSAEPCFAESFSAECPHIVWHYTPIAESRTFICY